MTVDEVRFVSETSEATAAGRTYERTYHVYFAGGYSAAAMYFATEPDGISWTAALPKIGHTHPEDTGAVAARIRPELEQGEHGGAAGVARYVVSYEPVGAEQRELHPLSRAPEIEWAGSELTEVVRRDVTGAPIVNSAGDYYDPLPERPIRGGDCTITRNEADNPADVCTLASYTTNAAPWYGVAAGNGMLGKVTAKPASEMYEGELVTYWRVTYPIRFKRDGWRLELIDNGYRQIPAGATERQSVTDAMGQTPPVPVLLDGTGKELAAGGTPVVYPAGGYQIDDESEWGAGGLELPNVFA